MNKSNSRIKIAELLEATAIEDSHLMIVEDEEDTKQCTVNSFKKALSGDAYEPSSFKFYSSKQVQLYLQSIIKDLSTKANAKEIENIKNSISSIIASASTGKDTEIVYARDGKATLSDRLDYDRKVSDGKYMQLIQRTVTGKTLYIDNTGYIDISIIKTIIDETQLGSNSLTIHSRNLINYESITTSTVESDGSNSSCTCPVCTENGVKCECIKGVPNTTTTITIPMAVIHPAGKYIFMSLIAFSNGFTSKDVHFSIRYSDGTIDNVPYSYQEEFTFEAKKGFDKILIQYTKDTDDISTVQFKNMMLVDAKYGVPEEFVPFFREVKAPMAIGTNIYDYVNNNYIYECDVQNGELSITYYDTNITTLYLYNELMKLKDIINDKRDKCGRISDYGIYQYLDGMYVNTYPDGIKIEDAEDKYSRNGVKSKKITITENATRNSVIRIPLSNPIRIIETVGVFFYMDRTDYSLFTDTTGGIKIRLCSDNHMLSVSANYYECTINKKEMVQGWNFVKKRITDFTTTGNPDPNNIQYIYFEICRTDEMNRCSLYLNSFVFNQKMKPAVLFCMNGTYDESTTYLYPYLQTRKIKPTIFLNAKRTLPPEIVDNIMKYKIEYGWDIGMDSCHPSKEILVQDDNYRNQYVSLRNSWAWLRDTMVNTPISFSAAYGNLRPITVPILRDLGFKIAKTDSEGFCGFFSDKDFSMPMHLMSNETDLDDIINLIDYAIESNQTVVIYVNDVTEYGSEIDCKKVIFESVIDYINEKMEDGSIESLTFSDFYNECIK